MLKILKNLKESFWQVAIIVVLLCVQAAIDLALPDFTSKIVNIGIQEGKNDYILVAGFQMLGISLISMIAAILVMLLSSKVGAKIGKTLREKVFSKVLKFSHEEMNKFSTASLITRSTNDVQQIQQFVSMSFRVVVYAPIIGIGGFIKVLTNTDNSMAWIIGLAILLIAFVVGTLFIIAMPKFKKLQALTDKLNLVSREILTGLPVIASTLSSDFSDAFERLS